MPTAALRHRDATTILTGWAMFTENNHDVSAPEATVMRTIRPHAGVVCEVAWAGLQTQNGWRGHEGDSKGKAPATAVRGAPAPAHLLSPRESVVEAGHVSHDGLLIWPQSAYNICAERERKREREAGESDSCREGGRGRARGSCGRNSACSGLEAKPRLRRCGHISRGFCRGKGASPNRWIPLLTRAGSLTLATGFGEEALYRARRVKANQSF